LMSTLSRSSSALLSPLGGDIPPPTGCKVLKNLARACYLLILVTAPWFFGGVQTNVQVLLYAGMLLSLAIWIPAAIWQAIAVGLPTNSLPLLLVPILGGLVLGTFQLWPRPEAPNSSSIQQSIESAIAGADDEAQRQLQGQRSLITALQSGLTIARSATRFEMAKLGIFAATLFLATQLFASKKSQLFLWSAFAVNGAALAFFGIAQQLSWNGKLFWIVTLRHGGIPFSSFVNRNNAAGYLCLCLAGSVGLAILAFAPRASLVLDKAQAIGRARNFRRHRNRIATLFEGINNLTLPMVIAMTLMVLIISGIVLTASRGGWLALALGSASIFLFVKRIRSRFAIAVGVCLCCAILIVWAGLGDRVTKRWSASSADALAGDGRWKHWRDSMNAVRDFPVTGTGLGTYRFANLPYQSSAIKARFFNADNQFVEWLVEGGFVGLSLVLTSILLAGVAVRALLTRLDLNASDPVGVVGLFALASQCVSACFDFGPTIPANMLGLAAVFGAVVGRAALSSNIPQPSLRTWGLKLPPLNPPVLVPLFGIAFLAYGCIGLREVQAMADIHHVSRNLPPLDSPDSLSTETVTRLIEQLSTAISRCPDDAEGQLCLGELWIYRFRIEEFLVEIARRPDEKPQPIWIATHPGNLYRLLNGWEESGQRERIESLIETPLIQSNLINAYSHLAASQAACPLVPDVDRLLATLAFVGTPDHLAGESHLRRALMTTPLDPDLFFEIGALAQTSHLSEFANFCWKRSLELSPEYLAEIHKLLIPEISIESQITNVFPASPQIMLRLAEVYPGEANRLNRYKLANEAVRLLSAPSEPVSESQRRHDLGRARLFLDDSAEAVNEYRRAIALSPQQVEWRLELARILQYRNEFPAALEQLEIGEILAPSDQRFKTLVHELQKNLMSQ
jgi:tetratricopeptide (TPR) repeat protein